MTKLELIEHLFTMQENAKMKASYTADEVVGMLNAVSVKVAEMQDEIDYNRLRQEFDGIRSKGIYDGGYNKARNNAVEALSTLLAEGYIDSKDVEQAQARLKQLLSNT